VEVYDDDIGMGQAVNKQQVTVQQKQTTDTHLQLLTIMKHTQLLKHKVYQMEQKHTIKHIYVQMEHGQNHEKKHQV